VLSLIVIVRAETEEQTLAWSQPPKVSASSPTLWEKLQYLFRLNEFTIVGQDRLCDAEPLYRSGSISGITQTNYFARGFNLGYWSFPQGYVGGTSQTYASRFCSSGHGLYDVYCDHLVIPSAGNLGTPRFEMKDAFYFFCSSSCQRCNVELYCCPQDCGEGDSCPSGRTCQTKSAVDPIAPLKDAYTGVDITFYQYCKLLSGGCSGSPTTCWRVKSDWSDCESATYTCDQEAVYKTSCPIGSYTYSSRTACREDNNIGGGGGGGGAYCGDGTCDSGETCSSCSTDCGSCSGEYCGDGTCNGDESCTTCSDDCGACGGGDTGTCGDGVCNDNEYYKADSYHTACPADCAADPVVKAMIYDVSLSDSNGQYISSTDSLQPGQTVTVKFKVRVKYSDFAARVCDGLFDCLGGAVPPLPGIIHYDSKLEYNIEAGIIPAVTAVEWFGKDANVGTFSIYDKLFAVSKRDSMCCENQPNIFADRTTYTQTLADKTWQWVTDNSQSYAISEHEIQLIVPKSDTTDFCPVPGRKASKYWDKNSNEYLLYIDVKNGCYSDNGVLTGYRNAIDQLYSVNVNVNGTGTNAGKICEIDADCGKGGTCLPCSQIVPPCGWYERWTGVKKCSGGITNNGTNTYSLKDFKKVPLTKEEISKATTPMLFASSCSQSSECLTPTKANYTSSCISIANLRSDGTIATEGAVSSLMDYGKGVVIGGTAGAIVGAATGMYFCQGLMVAKEVVQTTVVTAGTGGTATVPEITTKTVSVPIEMATCAALGGTAGGVIGGLIGSWMIKMDRDADPLVKAFNAKDASSIGICTAEESSQFDLGGIIKSIGNTIKITGNATWDGIIVIIGGIFLLMIFFNMMNKR
jgi:hypothetical protein